MRLFHRCAGCFLALVACGGDSPASAQGTDGETSSAQTSATTAADSTGAEGMGSGSESGSGSTDPDCLGTTPWAMNAPEPFVISPIRETPPYVAVLAARTSYDGRFTVFVSNVDAQGDALGGLDRTILRVDAACGTTEQLPLTGLDPVLLTNVQELVLSDDGGVVALTPVVPGGTEGFLYDIEADLLERFDADPSGGTATAYTSSVSLSTDGDLVAFASEAPGLVTGDDDEIMDVFVRDRGAGTSELVSVADDGTKANLTSPIASMSADGRFVAFESNAPNLQPFAVGGAHVYLRDRSEGTTTPVSPPPPKAQQATHNGYWPSISADGRFIAFGTRQPHLPEDDDAADDLYVYDRTTATLVLATPDVGTNAATHAQLSADGSRLAFWVTDTEGNRWPMVRDLTAGVAADLREGLGAPAEDIVITSFDLGTDGSYVVFDATNTPLADPAPTQLPVLVMRSVDALFD